MLLGIDHENYYFSVVYHDDKLNTLKAWSVFADCTILSADCYDLRYRLSGWFPAQLMAYLMDISWYSAFID